MTASVEKVIIIHVTFMKTIALIKSLMLSSCLSSLSSNPSINQLKLACSKAALTGDVDSLQVLSESGLISLGFDNSRLLIQASIAGRLSVVDFLLKQTDIDPSTNMSVPLRNACLYGYKEITRMLLDDGRSDINADDRHAIQYAAESGYLDIVRILLDEPDLLPCLDAIQWAMEHQHNDIVAALVKDARFISELEQCEDDEFIFSIAEVLSQERYVKSLSRMIHLLSINELCILYQVSDGDVSTLLLLDRQVHEHLGKTEYPSFIRSLLSSDHSRYLLALHHQTRREFMRAIFEAGIDKKDHLTVRAVLKRSPDLSSSMLIPYAMHLSNSVLYNGILPLLDNLLGDYILLTPTEEHPNLIVHLVFWVLHESFSNALRYLPFVNVFRPTKILQLIQNNQM